MEETREMIEILYRTVCSKIDAAITYMNNDIDELALAELKTTKQFFDIARSNALDMSNMIQDLTKKIESK